MLSISNNTNNSLKDLTVNNMVPYVRSHHNMSVIKYTKITKLITALYMVTDIMDTDEPIRNKLRTLGTEILSDISTSPMGTVSISRIDQIMSFIDIASAMSFISEMNGSILNTEFNELKKVIQQDAEKRPVWLEQFLSEDTTLESPTGSKDKIKKTRRDVLYKGHTRIGVQKGSTLMKALSDKIQSLSDKGNVKFRTSSREKFNIIKEQRRNNILSIIKNNGGESTIKDILTKINTNVPNELVCSEKTLQRELVSMINDGVLNKSGEKRWSKYLIKK